MAFERVFPTENDVGTTAQNGRVGTEENLAKWRDAPLQIHVEQGGTINTSAKGYVISGLEVSDGGGLTVDVTAGEAIVEGFRVVSDATTNIPLLDNTTTVVYVEVTKTGGLVDAAQFATGATDGTRANSTILALVTTSGGVVTDVSNEQRGGGVITGQYTGDGTINRTIDLSSTPSWVVVAGETEDIMGFSGPSPPLYRKHNSPPNRTAFSLQDLADDSIQDILTGSGSHDFGSISSDASKTTTVTVTGATAGDACSLGYTPNIPSACRIQWTVTAADTVTITIYNHNTVSETVGNISFEAVVFPSGQTKTIPASKAVFTDTTGGETAPYIVDGGFRVGVTPGLDLNTAAIKYNYIAVM